MVVFPLFLAPFSLRVYLVHQLGAHHIKGRHGAGHEEPEDGDRERESVGAWESGRVGEWVNRGESGARGERGGERESQTDEIDTKGRAKDHPRLAHMLDVEPSADAIYPTPR